MTGRRAIVVAAFMLLAAFNTPATAALPEAELRSRQQEAVRLARSGDLEAALAQLAALRATAPQDAPLLHDEIVVLSWAARDREVFDRAATLDARRTPAYVLNAAAKSARNLGDTVAAERWYRAAASADAGNADAGAGLALTLSDTGRLDEARTLLDSLPLHAQQMPAVRLASAYVYSRQQQYLPAIADYDVVLATAPEQREALRGKSLALRALLLPDQALALGAAHPGILTPEETAELQADALTMELRFALASPASADDPYEHLDRALAHYDTALAGELGRSPVAARLRHDRLVALVERVRYADAVAEYEALREAGTPIPIYVHSSACEAYLALRRPEQALAAITEAERLAPGDVEIRRQRFYAEAEVENYEAAIGIADAMVAELPPPAPQAGPGGPAASPEWVRAETLAAMGRAYADDLAAAEQRMTSVVNAAPTDAGARYDLGNVYRWRGWADRAIAEYQRVLAADPEWVAVQSSLADARMDRQEWRSVETDLDDLQRRHPDNGGVRNLGRRWDLHERSELRLDAGWGESSGDAFGTDQYDIEGWLYSPPLADNWRAFVHTFDSWAEFGAGNADRRRAGVGAEFRDGPWTAWAEINADRSGFDDTGFAGRADYRLSDQWSLGGLLELDSYATPLRADRAGIESDLAGVDLEYRRHESLAVGTGLRYQDFTDGNERTGIFANGRWRAFTAPRYKLDLTGYVAASDATETNTPYFNPDRDFELSGGLDNRWLMYRRYEQSLAHRLRLGAGIYDQKSFGSDGIWDLNYELIWSPNAAWELRAGWLRARRVYDGNTEYQTYWTIGINGRLL